MAKQTENLTWTNVDTDSLPRPLKKLYDDYKAAAHVAKAKRDAFEEAATHHLTKTGKVPAGKSPRWSYKFGKLGIAFGAQVERKASGGNEPFSF